MQGVFEKPTFAGPQTLLRNREYDNTAGTSSFVAEPSAVHFAGFERGKRHVRSVRIVNRSGYLAGLHVLPCEGTTFRARLANKRGAVAPGMAELVHVECTPEKEQHYQGAVRIHCGVRSCFGYALCRSLWCTVWVTGSARVRDRWCVRTPHRHVQAETLSVPVHAYPTATGLQIPRNLDFGAVAIGTTVRRTLTLASAAPIAFEFALVATPATHPDDPASPFSVAPMRGTVPARGSCEVIATFTARTHTTATCQLSLDVAQLFSKPLVCTLSGRAGPGAARDGAIAAFSGGHVPETMAELDGDDLLAAAVQRARSKSRPRGSSGAQPRRRPQPGKLSPIQVRATGNAGCLSTFGAA